MNNITKYLLIFILLVAIIFGGYYYFKFQSVRNKELEAIEKREEERDNDIDSISKINTSLQDSITDLTELIRKIKDYEPPKVNNSDLPNANSRELDSILTSYYK